MRTCCESSKQTMTNCPFILLNGLTFKTILLSASALMSLSSCRTQKHRGFLTFHTNSCPGSNPYNTEALHPKGVPVIWGVERYIKVARYSFLGSIPPTFERKLCRHKQRFGKINTTVVLNKDETLLWSGLQWHRSCRGNEMTPLPILLAAVYLGSRNCSSKIVY